MIAANCNETALEWEVNLADEIANHFGHYKLKV